MKNLKYLFTAMAAVSMATFTSCSSDDNNGTKDEEESKPVTSFDQVKYLQNNIIEIDSVGKMVQRVTGVPFNSADTTELTVGVEDVNDAKETFKSWLSPDTKVEEATPSTQNLKANLKDSTNTTKETVYFTVTSNNGPTIAEMTFASNKVMKHFSKVKFIKTSAWPENYEAYSPYNVGNIEQFETWQDGIQNWVCIREADHGKSGILMYTSRKEIFVGTSHCKHFASTGLARTASDIIKSDWNKYKAYFDKAGVSLEKGDYYWINDYTWYGSIYAIRLSDTDLITQSPLKPWGKKRNLQIQTFGLSVVY